ncbi:E7 [Macaca fascicularis papillomavirus 5]|uniref:Protein E7 n=1 Tax=Macaca fascicularis papillomavirus 5 TaxID=471183 RepID=C3PUA5_RHPV1|nr:E7 [Macaca fascicularis papillomavirus 5]
MIGPRATLEDIVLELHPEVLELDPEPEPVDLMCHEVLDSSDDDDEDAIDHHHNDATPVEQEQADYRIVCDCHTCGNTLRLVVHSTEADVRVLEDLLMGTLDIVCPKCAGRL